jgi:putative transposase
MSQSLAQIYVHIVFSTKGRAPYLQNRQLRDRTHAYLAGSCRNLKCPSIIIGGVEDHVHVLCRLANIASVSVLVRELKRELSKWMKEQSAQLQSFHWQNDFGAFSISPSHVEQLRAYIANQDVHHRAVTFQDEFRRLLSKYGIEYDEQYVWD